MSDNQEDTSSSSKPFTSNIAINALNEIIKALELDENDRLKKAQENVGDDMIKMMQLVFPVATQIQMDVLPKYGFTEDGDGLIRFTQSVKLLEKQNPEISVLNSKLRCILMPPIQSVLSSNGNSELQVEVEQISS